MVRVYEYTPVFSIIFAILESRPAFKILKWIALQHMIIALLYKTVFYEWGYKGFFCTQVEYESTPTDANHIYG